MRTLIFTLAWVLFVIPCQAQILYVDADANGADDGSSWANAYNHLQDALADANSHPDVNEIRVGRGIYKPDQNSVYPNGTGDRGATFRLINGVAIKGGYAGFGSPNPNARNINVFRTILSGDLDGNDVDVNDPADLLDDPTRNENSHHVVTGSATDASAVLDGLIVTAGNTSGSGGGMLNDGGDPTLVNCTFAINSAYYDGGAMYNRTSSPTLVNCTFSRNAAHHGGGMTNRTSSSPTLTNCTFSNNSANDNGGGMLNMWYSSPTLTDCTFSGNWASQYGGGMCDEGPYCSPTLVNCTFSGNSTGQNGGGVLTTGEATLTGCAFSGNSAGYGGGMSIYDSSATVTNCTFSGNSAGHNGGGMYNDQSSPTLTNCTFAGNSADMGGGVSNNSSTATLTNCILWGNTASVGSQIYRYGEGSVNVSYSDVQDGWPGLGNISADPCFVDPNGDYHLKSEGWYWDSVRRRWDYEEVTSRCIDAGNPGSPLRGELLTIPVDPGHNWGINLRINMGAYGGTTQASMPPYDWGLLADITNDGIVDGCDYAHQAKDWLTPGTQQPGDLNRNGAVNVRDLDLFVEDWLKTTTWHD